MTKLLIGIGNPDRGDDGVGVAVARVVARLAPPGVEVVTRAEPADLLDLWLGADEVVVVDAVRGCGPPGSVVRLDARATPLAASAGATSSHGFGVAEAVELGRALDRLPQRLAVVGVEVGRLTGDACALVQAAVGAAVDAALDALHPGAPTPRPADRTASAA